MATNSFIDLNVREILDLLRDRSSQLSPEQCAKAVDKVIEIGNPFDILRLLTEHPSQVSPEQSLKAVYKVREKADLLTLSDFSTKS
jgi:hypothetical protein